MLSNTACPGTSVNTCPCLSPTLPPLQRYLMALLTAAHQHNSGAASAAHRPPTAEQQQQQGHRSGEADNVGPEAAAMAPLTAALAGQQLVLSAPGGGSDVGIFAG